MKFVFGVDEVGRGPIAGPVAVGVFAVAAKSESEARVKLAKIFPKVKESKQLSEMKREMWYAKMLEAKKSGLIDFSVAFESEKAIDTKGIAVCIRSCIVKALDELVNAKSLSYEVIKTEDVLVLLDGGLKAPADFIHQKTIIKGDAKKSVIALASIAAKVCRDRKMNNLARKYPDYSFESHKGYGTKAHYKAIEKQGILPVHRKSFLHPFELA